MKRPRGATGQDHRLQLVAGQGSGQATTESPRSGSLRAVGSQSLADGARADRRELPAMQATAASSIHVVIVSLHGAEPPLWRRLEVPSAITLDRLHQVLQETFGWHNFGPHSFMTTYGEFGGPVRPTSRAAKRAAGRRDESGVALAQAAGDEGDVIGYLYGYEDEWKVDIQIEQILPAAPGVAYPRCTGGQGEDVPGEGYRGVLSSLGVELPHAAEDGPPIFPWSDDIDPEVETEMLAHLATVLVPKS